MFSLRLQCAGLVSRGAAPSGPGLGARLQSGKRVSISNPNSRTDEPVPCGIFSTTKHSQRPDGILATLSKHKPDRCRDYSPHNPRTKKVALLSSLQFWLTWMKHRRSACLLQVSTSPGYLTTFKKLLFLIKHIIIPAIPASQHAEVQQATRIQTRRSRVR